MSTISAAPLVRANKPARTFKLRTAREFQSVYKKGAKKLSPSFVVFMAPNGSVLSRFGVTTPRKLGAAHERNRIKRRVREIFRLARPQIPGGFDIVVNPRRSAGTRDFNEIRSELLSLLGVSL